MGAQADPRQGPARRGLPRRAVLPALRHRALRPRARPGLRDRHRPERLRALPADLRPVRRPRAGRPAGLDDDAVDAGVQHRRRRAPRRRPTSWPPTAPRRWSSPSRCSSRCSARAGPCGPGRRAPTWSAGPTSGPSTLVDFPAEPRPRRTSWCSADYVTTEDGTGLVHQSPAFGEDDMAVCRAYGLPVVNPVRPDGHFADDVPLVGGQFFKHADTDLVRDLAGARPAVPARALRAHLPALLALPHRAACTTPSRPGTSARRSGQGRAAAREREDQLVPRDHQARPLRRLAETTTSTGRCLAQPLLGHAAADLALRRGPPDLRRLAGRALAS